MDRSNNPTQKDTEASGGSNEPRWIDGGLLRAAKLGNSEEMEGWLAAGANPGAVDWESGRDALMMAIDRGHLGLVGRLAQICQLDTVDVKGRTCVDAARENAGVDLAVWLEGAREARREICALELVSKAGSKPEPKPRL